MYDIGLLIGEKDSLGAAGGATFDRLNPVTSDLATRVAGGPAVGRRRLPGLVRDRP